MEELRHIWPHLTAVLGITVEAMAVIAAIHAIRYKRDPAAAAAWAGLIIVFPLFGWLLYLLLGINRIHRNASLIRGKEERARTTRRVKTCTPSALADILPPRVRHLAALNRAVTLITRRPLVEGNLVVPLVNGDAAYPAMLNAIEHARTSISMATYIFDHDRSGIQFVDALGRAVRRGVEVRVLVDALGARYSKPSIIGSLRKAGVHVHRFMPTSAPWRAKYMNLRNHRKSLVVDGTLGFTGGMNVREGHVLSLNPKSPVQDIHFRVEGPVVSHLQDMFAEDWAFTTAEQLKGTAWFPELGAAGSVIARGIVDGPDEDCDKTLRTILCALACAHTSVRIMTPYFLPSPAIITALNTTAQRGVAVDIILPRESNLRWVGWAMMAQLWQVLEWGCHVWFSPPPFDHSKLMIVDDEWSLVGSANWDARSLRLNFEFNVECYCPELARSLDAIFEQKRIIAQRVRLEDVDKRSALVKFRDSFARLFTPYL